MFAKRDILFITSGFLFFVCLVSPPFPALRNNSTSRIFIDSSSNYLRRGNFYFNQGKYDLAIADYNKALQINFDAITYLNRGDVYTQQKKYDLAIADYNKAKSLFKLQGEMIKVEEIDKTLKLLTK